MAHMNVKAALIIMAAVSVSSFAYAQTAPVLDRDSQRCISCHKDVMAPEKPGAVCHMGDCSHPVGVDYSVIARNRSGLRKPDELDSALKLVNNAIGCTTCHVPYNEYDHRMLAQKRKEVKDMSDPMLTMDNSGSKLCLGCHIK